MDKASNISRKYIHASWIGALTVASITFLVYLPALGNGFVNWDDNRYVYENPNIRSIDFNFLRWIITGIVAGLWHPLTLSSIAIDYAIWGSESLGYHLTNIFFHTINSVLVFILVLRLTGHGLSPSNNEFSKKALFTGFTTALIFGVHPLHVESVAWVSERKDVLCAFFYLLGLIAYLKYIFSSDLKKTILYAVCLISFIMALMSKPMAVSFPIVLLILDLYPLRRLSIGKGLRGVRDIIIEKLPFFLFSLLSSVITIWAHHSQGGLASMQQISICSRIFVAARAYIFYIVKMVLPFNLAPLYPHPVKIYPFAFEYLISLVLISMITFFCVRSVKRGSLFSAIWVYYIVTLLPVIGIVQVGGHAAADRYTYLPSLGPFQLAGLGITYLYEGLKKQYRTLLIVAFIFLIGILANKTVSQINVWKDSITLWSHEIKLFPYATVAYVNRGSANYYSGKYVQAIEDYKAAVELDPELAEAYYNLGSAYMRIGDIGMARIYDKKAASLGLRNR